MDEQLVTQLLALLLASLAVLLAAGRVFVGRIEVHNRQAKTQTEIALLRYQIQNMREKTDVETRDLVNDILQQYMDENEAQQARIQQLEVKRAEERATMYAEIHSLRDQLKATAARVDELEAMVAEKNSKIAALERSLQGDPDTLSRQTHTAVAPKDSAIPAAPTVIG